MTDDDDAAEFVTRSVAGAGAAGACPDGNLLAGWAERTLTAAEAEAVAAHAAGCTTCRRTLADLAEAGVGAGAPAEPIASPAPLTDSRVAARPRRPAWHYAAAALVLVAAGAGVWALSRPRGEPTPYHPEQRLLLVARDLATEHPALAGFTPVPSREMDAQTTPQERGGIRLIAPSDVVLPGRPLLRWLAVPGVTRYEVRLEKEGGPTLFTRTTEAPSLSYPADVAPLEPGARYVWTVAVEAVLGGKTEARRSFAVATPEASAAFAAATRAIAEHAPEDLRDLLAAHWALRHDLVFEAERLASAYSAGHRSDVLGLQTLFHVWRRQGLPEAGGAGRGAPGPR